MPFVVRAGGAPVERQKDRHPANRLQPRGSRSRAAPEDRSLPDAESVFNWFGILRTVLSKSSPFAPIMVPLEGKAGATSRETGLRCHPSSLRILLLDHGR